MDRTSDGAVDALVVLGVRLRRGRLPRRLTRRLELAAVHYHGGAARGRPPWVVVSGGGPAGEPTEAAVMAEHLVALGVPAAAVLREERARDTGENLRYSMALLPSARTGTITVVTSGYHVPRTRLLATRPDPGSSQDGPGAGRVRVVGARTPLRALPAALLREAAALLLIGCRAGVTVRGRAPSGGEQAGGVVRAGEGEEA